MGLKNPLSDGKELKKPINPLLTISLAFSEALDEFNVAFISKVLGTPLVEL